MQGGRLQMADICLYFFEMFLFDRLLLQIYLMYEGQIRQLAVCFQCVPGIGGASSTSFGRVEREEIFE